MLAAGTNVLLLLEALSVALVAASAAVVRSSGSRNSSFGFGRSNGDSSSGNSRAWARGSRWHSMEPGGGGWEQSRDAEEGKSVRG